MDAQVSNTQLYVHRRRPGEDATRSGACALRRRTTRRSCRTRPQNPRCKESRGKNLRGKNLTGCHPVRLGKLGGLHLLPQGIGWRCSGMTESVDIYFLGRPCPLLFIFLSHYRHKIIKSSSYWCQVCFCMYCSASDMSYQVRHEWRGASQAFLWLT